MTEKGKRRRGHNEGSLYQRDDGVWVAAVSLGTENGKRRRKYVYGKSRADVNKKRIQLQHDHQRGMPIQTAGTTVSAFLERWLDSVKPNVGPKTYKSYSSIVNCHLIPTIGRNRLEKLTQQHVHALIAAKTEEGLSPHTVEYIRNVLNISLNRAMDWDLVPRNIPRNVRAPNADDYEPRILTPTEAKRLIEYFRGDRLEALYALALSVGLRQGELLGLFWEDIDFVSGTISIRRQRQVIDGQVTFPPPKSAKGRRTFPLPPQVKDLLVQHRARQLEELQQAGGRWQAQWGVVFATPIGTSIDDSNLRKDFKQALLNCGLPDMRFHSMRHFAASMMIARGTPITVVRQMLGHANVSTTLALYARAYGEDMREAAVLMGDLYRFDDKKDGE